MSLDSKFTATVVTLTATGVCRSDNLALDREADLVPSWFVSDDDDESFRDDYGPTEGLN